MCARFISTAPDPVVACGSHIATFIQFTSDLQNVTRTSAFARVQLVNESQRPAFEAAAVDAAQLVDASGALAARVRTSGIRAFAAGVDLAATPAAERLRPRAACAALRRGVEWRAAEL